MKKNVVLLTLILILPAFSTAGESKIYGRIILPVPVKKESAFPGMAYRNRLTSPGISGKKRAAAEDVIVLAYPLSFRPVVKPMMNVRLLQKESCFVPRVLPVTPGTTVFFINRDRYYHDVFSLTPGARFDIGRRPTGTAVGKTIKQSGELKLFCDIHPGMTATILCVETPYFTRSSRNGVYLLKNLPPGRYRLEVYHPDLKRVAETVDVKKNKALRVDFNLKR